MVYLAKLQAAHHVYSVCCPSYSRGTLEKARKQRVSTDAQRHHKTTAKGPKNPKICHNEKSKTKKAQEET